MAKKKIEKSEKKVKQKSVKEKKRKLHTRILKKLLKIVLIWIPLLIVVVLGIVLVVARLYLSPVRVEKLIIENFNKKSNGTISCKVTEFSPYGGFVIENIIIKNSAEFDNSDFVKIKRLVFHYGFFSIFAGNIHFDEIGIYKPRIYLTQKKGIWNVDRLMIPGEKPPPEPEEKEPEKEQKEEAKEKSNEINIPLISINFLFKFVLDDLHFYLNGETMQSHLKGLSFNTFIKMPDFNKVPLSLAALNLFEKVLVELNPREELDIAFSSKDAALKPPLILTWKLLLENLKGQPLKIESNLKLGTYKTPVRFKRVHLAPLNLLVHYDLFYNPGADKLTLNSLGVSFQNKKWINIGGSIENVTSATSKQTFNLYMKDSLIVLDDLYPYYYSLTGDRKMFFRGSLSLKPLSIRGSMSVFNLNGLISLNKIYFRQPGTILHLPKLGLKYNIGGSMKNLHVQAHLSMPRFSYQLGRNLSGPNGLELDADLYAKNNFKLFDINKIELRFFNPITRKAALKLALDGYAETAPALNGKIRISKFVFYKPPLLDMLPSNFKKQLSGVPLNKPVTANLSLGFGVSKLRTRADLALGIKVPDFELNDLKLNAGITMNHKKQLKIRKLLLTSKSKGLRLSAGGTADLSKAPLADSDLKLSLQLDYPKVKNVHGPWNIKGKVALNAFMKGDMQTGKAHGNFKIVNLNLKNSESKLAVNKMNFDFPFSYDFAFKHKGGSKISLEKSRIIENKNFQTADNFTIKSVEMKHPARDEQIALVQDFGAAMFFSKNTFEIPKLKVTVLDGSVYARNILFYLADFKLQNYQYKFTLDVTNVDVGKLDEFKSKKKKRDAELSLNADISGIGLDLSKELPINGYVNIHKIGEKFARQLLTGLNEEKGKSKLGGIGQYAMENTMEPRGFSYNIDDGMMYANVALAKVGVGGLIIGIEKGRIKYDRVPMQDYLKGLLEKE